MNETEISAAEKGITADGYILSQAALFGRKRGEQPGDGNVCRKTADTCAVDK